MDTPVRITKLQSKLTDIGWSGVFVAPGDDLHYLAGFSPTADERPCFLAITPTHAAWLMPALNSMQVSERTDLEMFTYSDAEGPGHACQQLLAHLDLVGGQGHVLGATDDMRADFLLLLQAALTKGSWRAAGEAVSPLRSVKDADEISRLQRASEIADRAVEAAFATVRLGVTEREIGRVVEETFAAEGADEILFCIIGAGANASFPHHHTGDSIVRDGTPVLIDIGCQKDGYCSDITRMAHVGRPSDEYRRVHDAVDAAVKAAFAAARPGAAVAEVDRAAREVIERAGYGEYFVHRTGHGIGMSAHENPSVHGKNNLVLEEGMVFTIEPGIYLPGRFGVRLEEIAVLEATSVRRLSTLPRDVVVVNRAQ